MKYVNQIKYPHKLYKRKSELDGEKPANGQSTTIKSSGCGLCSAVMVADRLLPDSDFDLDEAIEMAYQCEANCYKGTTYTVFAPRFAERCGFDLEMTNDPERLRYCLRTGGAAVLHSKGDREGYTGVFTHGGHYVVAISEERDGRIAILDPAYSEGRYEEEGRKGLVEVKNGVIAVCDMDVIIKDTMPAEPSFYLFWRK